MFSDEQLAPLRSIYPEARALYEGSQPYVFIPQLAVSVGDCTRHMDGLLCPGQHGGYSSRLFLAESVIERGANWTHHNILGRLWHTWSWNGVSADLPLVQMLLAHLGALR